MFFASVAEARRIFVQFAAGSPRSLYEKQKYRYFCSNQHRYSMLHEIPPFKTRSNFPPAFTSRNATTPLSSTFRAKDVPPTLAKAENGALSVFAHCYDKSLHYCCIRRELTEKMRPLLRAAAAIPPLALRGDYWAPITLLPYIFDALRHAGPGVQARRPAAFFRCIRSFTFCGILGKVRQGCPSVLMRRVCLT